MTGLSRMSFCGLSVLLAASTPAVASQYRDAPMPVGIQVSRPGTSAQVIAGCLQAAASTYRISPVVLVILLHVEGGQLGRVTGNTNATVDIGPMQVNEIWLPDIARHWHASVPQAFVALRDSFCANVEGASWILRQGLDEAGGDFWQGVGYYHSHNPVHKTAYLRKVLDQALRLQALSDRSRLIERYGGAHGSPTAPSPSSTMLNSSMPSGGG